MDSTGHAFATYPSLKGKVVIITGASEGIGASAAELFTLQGSKVHIIDFNPDAGKLTIQRIGDLLKKNGFEEGKGYTIPKFWQCDVTHLDQLKSSAEGIVKESEGVVDVLVNNAASAGGAVRRATPDVELSGWTFGLDVSLRHVFFLTQFLLPYLKRTTSLPAIPPPPTVPEPGIVHISNLSQADSYSSVINMSSISPLIPATGLPVYTTAKYAIHGLTRTHAHEFGPYGVRVNSVLPGATATEKQVKEVLTEGYREEVMRRQALKRDLGAVEVARVVVWLASGEAGAVTGTGIVVDGGWVGS